MKDYRGVEVSGATPRALALYEQALQSLWLQRGDALQLARRAIASAPQFAAARILEASLLTVSRDVRDFEAGGWAFARLREVPMNRREGAHAMALACAIDGDWAAACRQYDRILAEEPFDIQALWSAQSMDYYLGNPEAMRGRAGRVAAQWPAALPGHHAVLAMHAYALAECGDYAEAEQVALHALQLEPLDVRAEHALLHVFEMQGRAAEGLLRIADPAINHMSWHRALFHLQLDRPDRALAVYDSAMRLETLSDLIDASSLLWRVRLAGADVSGRFREVAARWAQHAEDAYCAFNDVHAMMAFVAAERWEWAQRLLAAQEKRLARVAGANHDMTRLVGYPASRAIAAFGRGDYRGAEALLRGLPPVAHRIGGSHAQRDILMLTRAAATLRRPRLIPGEMDAAFAPRRLAAA
jgi:tetratricopeptide (TPR) repeat protein